VSVSADRDAFLLMIVVSQHANVRGHVVRALIVVFVVRVFGNELLEKPFDIAPCLGGRVLHRGQAATRVLHEIVTIPFRTSDLSILS